MVEQVTLKKGDTLPEVELQLLQASPSNLPIKSVDTGNDQFVVNDDYTDTFTAQRVFEVVDSTGNNGDYTVTNSSYSSSNDETTINVEEDVTDSTADGEISFKPRIPVDLSGASVKFYVYDTGKDNLIIDGSNVTIENTSLGKIRYKFVSGDVEETGVFPGEFVATYSDGDLTFPNTGYLKVVINEDAQGGFSS